MTRKKSPDSASRFISFILRHNPSAIGITLDEHGWADVNDMLEGINASSNYNLDMNALEEIVRTDEKGRYSFNEEKTLIRANQGHSIPVDVELEKKVPPAVLYHGSAEKYTESIEKEGLRPMSRLYVHLSKIWRQRKRLEAGTVSWLFMKLKQQR